MIDIRNLSFYYDNEESALLDIDINIKKGESVALIGPNGCGKSTLLKVINGLVFGTKGDYLFLGDSVDRKTMKKKDFTKNFHRKIGFIFQDSSVQLFCTSVYEEIAFGLKQMGYEENIIKDRVCDILKFLDIEHIKNKKPYHLSGGEKKKVAIGAALILNPLVLTLDEPLNGLDPKSKMFIKNMLIDLNKSGKTIICATHDFHYVDGIFERAIVFSKDHKIIRDGKYKDIIEDKEFLKNNNII
ncbi:MAG: energy-coupling factor ABC transporter ATP-binding protein [Clostridiaceae bacterium]